MDVLSKLTSLPTKTLLLAITFLLMTGLASGLREPDVAQQQTLPELTVAIAAERPFVGPPAPAFIGMGLAPWRDLVMVAAVDRPRNLPTIPPAYGIITSKFGTRTSPFDKTIKVFHAGIDIAAPKNAIFVAPAGGVVTSYERKTGYGALVTIDHGDGVETRYAHASTIFVQKGETVRRGQVLGTVGTAGHATGPHLHYEVWDNGKPIDPGTFLDLPTHQEIKGKLARKPGRAAPARI